MCKIKSITIFIIIFLFSIKIYSQAPDKFNYQMVVRDGTNNVIANQMVAIQISILKTSASGVAVYIETHTPTTNTNGTVSFVIGDGGVITGIINSIDWLSDNYYIKTELDIDNDGNYDISGVSQFLTVPYALHANNLAGRTYNVNTYYPELGGLVIEVTPNGKHGIVASMQDQSNSSNWYDAQGFIDDPSNHDIDGKKFRDCRLPTSRELGLIYLYRVELNTTSGIYWSDSQINELYARSIRFTNNTFFDTWKTSTFFVRAIRTF